MTALTKEELAERRKGIGGSDALKIVKGDWYALWLDKTGREEPKAILSPWDAAVRHALEPIILDHYATKNNIAVAKRGFAYVGTPAYLRCTLDGWDERGWPVDAKALNLFTPDAMKWAVEHYTPQMHHQMIVTGARRSVLAVSVGMKEPVEIPVERDDFFEASYLESCEDFWRYVESDTPPPGGPVLDVPVPIKELRTVDMSGNNRWAMFAGDWLGNRQAAATFDVAVKGVKALVESDVGEAAGHGIIAKRDGRGISIKEIK